MFSERKEVEDDLDKPIERSELFRFQTKQKIKETGLSEGEYICKREIENNHKKAFS